MNAIFINSENRKPCDPHRLWLNLPDKVKEKYVALSNLNIYYTWKNKKSDSKSKLSGPIWGEVFELSDGLYSVSDIQDYFIGSSKNLKTNR